MGFVRITIALIAICFFLYFFAFEIKELIESQNTKSTLEFNNNFEDKFVTLNEERIAWLNWYLSPEDPELKEKYENLVEETEGMLQELSGLVLDRTDHMLLLENIQAHADIHRLVTPENFSIVTLFNFYMDLYICLSTFWGEICETTMSDANIYILTDISWTSYLSFYTLMRDLMITVEFISSNLTEMER